MASGNRSRTVVRRRAVAVAVVVLVLFGAALVTWARGPALGTSTARAARIAGSGGAGPAFVTAGPSLPAPGDGPLSQGDSSALPNGTHDVVITVTSDQPLASVGWQVKGHTPASRKLTDVRSPYRLHVLAHGEGLVASVAAQAGPRAGRTTCSVTVDGAVRSTRTRQGGYEVVVCLG